MYCPSCGKENSAEQRFCRACGLRLQVFSEALAKELSPGVSANELERDRGPRKLGSQPLLMLGFLIMMFGVILGVIGKNMLSMEWISSGGALTAIVGMALMGYSVIRSMASVSRPTPKSQPPADLTTDKATRRAARICSQRHGKHNQATGDGATGDGSRRGWQRGSRLVLF